MIVKQKRITIAYMIMHSLMFVLFGFVSLLLGYILIFEIFNVIGLFLCIPPVFMVVMNGYCSWLAIQRLKNHDYVLINEEK